MPSIDRDAFMKRIGGDVEPGPADPAEMGEGETEGLSPGEQLCHALGLPGGPDKDYAGIEEAIRRIVSG